MAAVERRKWDHIEEEQKQIDQKTPLQTNGDHGQVAGASETFDSDIAIEIVSARGDVTVLQQALDTSDLETIIEFKDLARGSAWYTVRIASTETRL